MVLEVTTIGSQILLPLGLLAWMSVAPLRSRVVFWVQVIVTLAVLVALRAGSNLDYPAVVDTGSLFRVLAVSTPPPGFTPERR